MIEHRSLHAHPWFAPYPPSEWPPVRGGSRRIFALAAVAATGERNGLRSDGLFVARWLALLAAAFLFLSTLIPAWGHDVPMLVTQLPPSEWGEAERPNALHDPGLGALETLPAVGGRIVLVLPDGTLRVLTKDFYSASDPAASFDGKRILFAGQRNASDPWNIFELSLDDSTVRQVTRDCGNCRQPGYQSTLYTIVSTEPWYQLTFVSDMAGKMNERGTGLARSLYSCKLDGSEVRRLTYNLADDLDPFQMLDGRLAFSSCQRSTLERGTWGRAALFGVNIDGTDYALLGDVSGRRVKRMPCVTDRGLVVFVEADRLEADGSGQLAAVTFRRPLKSYRTLTAEADGFVYSHPSPWPGGRVLVARRPTAGRQTRGIWLFDPKTGAAEKEFDDPQYDNVQAIALRSGREPDGRSSVVNEEDPNGKLYCLNVNLDDSPSGDRNPPGTARRVRFLEGVPLDAGDASAYLPPLPQSSRRPGSTCNGLPPLVQRRMIGEIDISPDGSFQVDIPANTPVQLQTLDENGVALRTCGWIWSKNQEPRGCIGCHEDGELTPENTFTLSLRQPSIALTLPPERRRTVDFRRDIMPIIEKKCVVCHDAQGDAPRLDGALELVTEPDGAAHFNRAYLSLLATRPTDGEDEFNGLYVEPGKARTSPLIWHLLGRNLSRPWDGDALADEAKPIPAGRAEPLTDLERRAFVEWVDLGASWDGIPGPDDLPGGR